MKSLIETQFPIARLSAEAYKERKSGAGQTLTGLGKWWGRKPLILVRASILGMLMPASDDPQKDREIFLKILTMDDEGAWLRCKGEIPAFAWREVAPPEVQAAYFSARGFRKGLSEDEKAQVCAQIWAILDETQKAELDRQKRRPVKERLQFDHLPYSERIVHCERPENVMGPSVVAWADINAHLGTTAHSLPELVEQLGQRQFGHSPRVGDSFCGGGSIPFEAARMGCEAFGSDLNPVAALLTWASIDLLGASQEIQSEVQRVQEAVFDETDRQICAWGIEHSAEGERADAYLYCVEVKPEGCDYYIPLAPSWVISEKYRIVVKWIRIENSDRLHPEVIAVSEQELKLYKEKKGSTVIDSRVVDPFDPSRSWSIEALRGPQGLRHWTQNDLAPRPEDVFQERLYCIRWVDSTGHRRYAAPTSYDLENEEKVFSLLQERFLDWQKLGFMPFALIPKDGVETARLPRERGWTHWHHLFTQRQLLIYGLYLSNVAKNAVKEVAVSMCLNIATQTNWNSKLNVWNSNLGKGGGAGYSEQTFANQALNPLYNYGTRSFGALQGSLLSELKYSSISGKRNIVQSDARDIQNYCDLWITDPPYADAVNYHELGDFFLAWYNKQITQLFPEWTALSRSELAVRGNGEHFRRSMVEIYRNLSKHMPDNGLQMVMFTHQDPSVWADLGMILWASGLKATAAWTISTETSAGLKKGNYVQGTVCLVLRKRLGQEPGFLDEVYPLVEDEVRHQLASMQALDEGGEPNFNDADYQLAAYAAALKVLTQYSSLDGRDVEHEVFAERTNQQKSEFQKVIERALTIACDTLIPKGLELLWRELTLVERYYLRALDIESRGERRKGMYEELARGFGIADIRPLLKSDKANGTRMFTPSGFAASLLATLAATQPQLHPFAISPLRHLLFAVRETTLADRQPEVGRQYLRETFGQGYWAQRERLISLLDWLAALGNAEGMHEWIKDSEAARILAGRLRNDQG
jgi:putative DNA methylase